MQTKIFTQIEAALAFATFKDEDVEKTLKRLIKISDSDLNEAGFEESAAMDEAADEVIEAINDADPLEEDEKDEDVEDENTEEDEDEIEEDEVEDEDDNDSENDEDDGEI